MTHITTSGHKQKFNKKTVRDIDLNGKKILLRVDYNVPTEIDGSISDDSRIRASLPTINYLLEKNTKIIICSHFGRPKGKINESMRLAPVSRRLSELINKNVKPLTECIGTEVEKAVNEMQEGDIILLENVRFYPEEEKNETNFARSLAGLADIYVNDAFGAAHRSHASVTGVASFLPGVAGLLMEKELKFLGQLLGNPSHPFVSILGGAKVSDKLGVIENILDKVNILLIGGGMAANFLKAKGYSTGKSIVEADKTDYINKVLEKAQQKGVKVLLPVDVVVTEKLENGYPGKTVTIEEIPDTWIVADIGKSTINRFREEINQGKTIFWNGPMGVFEIESFSRGTAEIVKALAESKAHTIIGGGSTAEAVEHMGMTQMMTHVSTGGGASLEFLEGKELPGVAVLEDM